MLKDWNTMENANLVERKLLKRVDELPIGTVIYGLSPADNEVTGWIVDERVGDTVYLYALQAYIERTFIVKTDDGKELQFKDADVCKAREYFKDKTYKHVDIQSVKTALLDTPSTSRFYFNVYPTSKKTYEVKVETIDTRYWTDRIHYKTYVLPIFNSESKPYYPNTKNLHQIAENVYSQLKYKFKNPNEYEICEYLIKSKDSHEDKLKMLDKLQHLPTYNYNVTDIRYSKHSDELTVRIDNTKIDLNSDIDVLDETVRLLDLQECRHCKCDNCKYYDGLICTKNVQVLRDNTPCNLYSPNKLYKIFEKEWNKSSTEAKQGYLDFVRKYLDHKRAIISKVSKEDNVTYFTDDNIFDRKPDEVVKAKYKQTYYPRRKKNKIEIEEL
jgi:hypothetical protein